MASELGCAPLSRVESALCFFFVQAEDGIRDLIVTGFQTCALPISTRPSSSIGSTSPKEEVLTIEELGRVARVFSKIGVKTVRLTGGEPLVRRGIATLIRLIKGIGRAACRGRG